MNAAAANRAIAQRINKDETRSSKKLEEIWTREAERPWIRDNAVD